MINKNTNKKTYSINRNTKLNNIKNIKKRKSKSESNMIELEYNMKINCA